MAVPAYRALQTTSTTGTGTLTLNAVSSPNRSMQDALGVSSVVRRFCIKWATGYEVFIGTYDGGSPGTITRTTVIESSNADALVNLSAGTKDVFIVPDFDEPQLAISGTSTLTLADLGNTVVFTGTSSATINLPAVATVPNGAGFKILNAGSFANAPILTIDPNGAETISGGTTIVVAPGESCHVTRLASAWIVTGLQTGFVPIQRQTTAGSSTTIDMALPAGFDAFQLNLRGVGCSGTPDLILRLSTDGGSTYLAGASDYSYGGTFNDGAPSPNGTTAAAAAYILLYLATPVVAVGAAGVVNILGARDAGLSTAVVSNLGWVRQGVSYQQQMFAGGANTAAAHSAVRLTTTSGATLGAGGVVTLLGMR